MNRSERRARGRWVMLNDGKRYQVVPEPCGRCGEPVEVFIDVPGTRAVYCQPCDDLMAELPDLRDAEDRLADFLGI